MIPRNNSFPGMDITCISRAMRFGGELLSERVENEARPRDGEEIFGRLPDRFDAAGAFGSAEGGEWGFVMGGITPPPTRAVATHRVIAKLGCSSSAF